MSLRSCIPGRKSCAKPVRYGKRKYKRRNRIEIMFGRFKDWRRVATRYDRCPTVFFSAICLAATVMFWLKVLSLMSSKYYKALCFPLLFISTRRRSFILHVDIQISLDFPTSETVHNIIYANFVQKTFPAENVLLHLPSSVYLTRDFLFRHKNLL